MQDIREETLWYLDDTLVKGEIDMLAKSFLDGELMTKEKLQNFNRDYFVEALTMIGKERVPDTLDNVEMNTIYYRVLDTIEKYRGV